LHSPVKPWIYLPCPSFPPTPPHPPPTLINEELLLLTHTLQTHKLLKFKEMLSLSWVKS
jgi:hypothetical protein